MFCPLQLVGRRLCVRPDSLRGFCLLEQHGRRVGVAASLCLPLVFAGWVCCVGRSREVGRLTRRWEACAERRQRVVRALVGRRRKGIAAGFEDTRKGIAVGFEDTLLVEAPRLVAIVFVGEKVALWGIESLIRTRARLS